jgi:YbbR domain-containing protein
VATTVIVPLQLLNVPSHLAISSNPPAQVRLSIRGPAGSVRTGDLSAVAVMVDLNGARPGDRIVPIDAANVTLPRGVTMERAQPSEVDVRLEQLVRREVPIRARVAIPPMGGWEVASTEVVPSFLQATGPESSMRGLTEATTEPLDLSHLQANAEVPAHALLENAAVRFENGSRVIVKVKLRKKD